MARPEFAESLERLIVRVEAWSYADSDVGAGQSRELARELKSLASIASTPALLAGVRHAQDALDDGLSAEVVAAALYRLRTEWEAGGPPASFAPPPGRPPPKPGGAPKRGPSPQWGRAPSTGSPRGNGGGGAP